MLKRRLRNLIASAPDVNIKAETIEAIAAHLVKNGVYVLPLQNSRVTALFHSTAHTGTLCLDGAEYSVYIAEMNTIQTGCEDISTLSEKKKTPSCIKHTFVIVEA